MIGRLKLSAAIFRDAPALVRQLRLVTGLILFTYVFLHFVNHSLGNISLEAMEQGATVQEWIWRGPIGTAALYGAFAIHFSLAFWALYMRRSLRMGWIEGLRLVLGFSIPLLVLQHVLAVRFAYSYFNVHLIYPHVLANIWLFEPLTAGIRQLAIFVVAWLHGCIGLYLWLRVKRHFHRVAPFLLVVAVVLPTTAMLGVFEGARQVAALIHTDPAFLASLRHTGTGSVPGLRAALWTIALWCWGGYALALGFVLIARGVRTVVAHRRGTVRIRYPDGRTVPIPVGLSVLDASRRAGIPHAAVCGGRARCSTCRVRVLAGSGRLQPPAPAELRVLSRVGTDSSVRLACQLRPVTDIIVVPLLPPDVTASDQILTGATETAAEWFIAILFVDIRRSTQLVEHRLPYDVVFILNRFFEAVGSAVVAAGGVPNQFSGDGVMALFGIKSTAEEACRQALLAAHLIDWQLSEMNRSLAEELSEPITIGIGIHAGEVILGTMGYREHSAITAIGDAVHVASRLQELTKEYDCQLVISEIVGEMGGIVIDSFPSHDIQVRGRKAPLTVRVVGSAAALGWASTPAVESGTEPVAVPA